MSRIESAGTSLRIERIGHSLDRSVRSYHRRGDESDYAKSAQPGANNDRVGVKPGKLYRLCSSFPWQRSELQIDTALALPKWQGVPYQNRKQTRFSRLSLRRM